MWDKTRAVNWSQSHKQAHSLGLCAQYTRESVEAGGVVLKRHDAAKDYGSSLVAVGFVKLHRGHGRNQAGDVGIVQPVASHPYGHMAMFDGTHWISDFEQKWGLYPALAYVQAKSQIDIYRYQVQFDSTAPSCASHLC